MTDHTGWHASLGWRRIHRQVIGTPNAVPLQPAYFVAMASGQTRDQLPGSRRDSVEDLDCPEARMFCELEVLPAIRSYCPAKP